MRPARILGKGRQHGTRELKPTRIRRVLQMRQNPEPLGIAFVVEQISALIRVQPGQILGMRCKPRPHRIFTGVTKRRITNIVRQTGSGHHRTKIGRMHLWRQTMTIHNRAADHRTQRAPHTGGLQTMRQTRTNIIALRQRKHLRLILEPTERRGKDNAVVILLKAASVLGVSNQRIGFLRA